MAKKDELVGIVTRNVKWKDKLIPRGTRVFGEDARQLIGRELADMDVEHIVSKIRKEVQQEVKEEKARFAKQNEDIKKEYRRRKSAAKNEAMPSIKEVVSDITKE